MSDRLTVAVTRLLSTTHWCFIDAPADCDLDPKKVLFPAKTVDLFIQLLIPCAHNIHEEDLTFSLKSGMLIWHSLWKNVCPDIPSFKRPVFLEKCKSASPSSSSKRGMLKYFDMVVLNSLSKSFLCEESLCWCLIYISQLLHNEFHDYRESLSNTRNLKYGGKKSVAVRYSMPLLQSQSDNKPSSSKLTSPESDINVKEFHRNSRHFEELETVFLSDEYEQWLREDGRLHHSAVLDLVYKISKGATLRLCETLLLTLHILLELGVVSEKEEIIGDIDVNLETTVYCLLDLITMIGCNKNDSGMRGSKGQDLRVLSHDMFSKLASTYPHQLSLLVVLYVRNKSVAEVLNFLHSFTGLCFGKFDISPIQSRKKGTLADINAAHRSLQSEASSDSDTSYVKEKNEEILMSWLGMPLLDKFMLEDKACKEEHRHKITKLLSYINSQHPRIMRKMVMNGVLNSFSKSTDGNSVGDGAATFVDGSARHRPSESGSLHSKESKSKTKLWSRANATADSKMRKKLPLTRARGLTIDDFGENTMDTAGSPELVAINQQSSKKTTRPSRESSSLSKTFANNNKFKIFKGTKRSRMASVVYSAVEPEDSPVFVDKVAGPKLIDLSALLKGIKHFRFISSFIAPGHVPEAALIAALMDLRAPVLARAAVLLECCHLVHACNKGTGDVFSRPEFSTKKDMAMMFHKWALAIGGKLESIIEMENEALGERTGDSCTLDMSERNFLHEGDLSTVSTYCPYGLKLLACQLLLEITAFLRDSCRAYGTDKENATFPKNCVNDNRKVSSASIAHARRSVASRSYRAPVIAVSDETGSTAGAKRKTSGYNRYVVGSSPKYQRKLSRRSSKVYSARPFKDHQPLTSSFDEDDEIPSEAQDLRWVSAVVKLVKFIHTRITEFKIDNWELRFEKSWKNLKESLDVLYNSNLNGITPSGRRSAVIGELSISPEQVHDQSDDLILNYLRYEVSGLHHVPFSMICKAALVIDQLHFMEMIPCAWHMLLHSDKHLVSAAAAIVLMSGAQIGSFVTSFIKKEMSQPDPTDRAEAVFRFSVLWKYRYNALSKMERNAISSLKIPPPKIDYTLPSPLIGRDPPLTADSPWVAGSPFLWETDDSEISQSEWYYDEEKRLEAKEKRRKSKLTKLRKRFHLRNVPLSTEAGTEAKGKEEEDEDEGFETSELFPPSICAVALDVIRLMDDTALALDGKSVGCVAYQVVWNCLVDDPDLFFRSVYEKITKINKQEEVLLVLRKLIQQMPVLPPVAGTYLFNNLVGLIMYYNRTNKPGCQKRISSVLHVLWQVVPSVSNLFLKDMKQVLRKENCEEIRVMFEKGNEKFEVNEDSTFASLVNDCKKRFDLFDKSLVLIDKYSGWLMESSRQVRDSFAFKRGFAAPVVKLERMDRERCYEERQAQAIIMKMSEISRLNLSGAILNAFPYQKHDAFLFLALLKQNAFPRKAIEFEFELCQENGLAKELLTFDVVLKDTWMKFICTLLMHLDETATAADEIEIFLSVLNGALLLLCDNVAILRSCLGCFINISRHFGQIFAVSGYEQILPTLLKVYAQHQDNTLVTEAIEFAMGTFLTLHQSPFLLQLFASAAPILQSEVTQELLTFCPLEQIPSRVFFKLLLSLDRRIEDTIGVLGLVRGEKPIRPFDSVCKIENIEFSVIDIAVRLAVTVIASRPASSRGIQMLVVISAVMPHYLCHIKMQTRSATLVDEENEGQEMMFKEIRQLRFLLNYLKVVIENSKHLGRPFSKNFDSMCDNPDGIFDDDSPLAKPNVLSLSWWSSMLSNVRTWFGLGTDHASLSDDMDRISVTDELPVSSEEQMALKTFCLPRMSLLYLVSEFVTNGATRVREIKEVIRRRVAFQDIVVDKLQVLILTDIVSSLLSLAPRNQDILSNIGFERFMLQAIPAIKWTDDKIPFLLQIVDNMNEILRKSLIHTEQLELIDLCVQVILCDSTSEGIHSVSVSFTTMAAKLAARLIQANPSIFSLPVVCGDYYLDADLDRLEKFLIHWFLPLSIRLGTGRYDYPSLSSQDVEFALSVILSYLSPFASDSNFGSKVSLGSQNSLDFAYDTSVAAIRTRQRSQSLHLSPRTYKILFLGLKVMLVAFEDCFGPFWKTTAETVEKLMKANKVDAIRKLPVIDIEISNYRCVEIVVSGSNESLSPDHLPLGESKPLLGAHDLSMWDFLHFIVDNRSTLLVHLLPVIADKVKDEQSLSNEIRSRITRIERDLWNPPTCPCKGDVLKHLLDELADVTHANESEEGLHMLSSPPARGRGRSRTKSTYKRRSETLIQYDKKWEDYDKPDEYSQDPFQDDVDSFKSEKVLSRKRSSKKVTIASKPIVLDEAPVRKPSVGDEDISRSSSKKILKRRPVLRRQSAEEEIDVDTEASVSEETSVDTGDKQDSQRAKVHNFNRQRFQHVRKREDSKSYSARKKDKWKRDNSYRYRQKMQHQVSFNEEEENEGEENDREENEGGELEEAGNDGGVKQVGFDANNSGKENRGVSGIDTDFGVEKHVEETEQCSNIKLDMTSNDDIHPKADGHFINDVKIEMFPNVYCNAIMELNSPLFADEASQFPFSQETERQSTLQNNSSSSDRAICHHSFGMEVHRVQHVEALNAINLFHNGHIPLSPSASSDAPLIDDSCSSDGFEELGTNFSSERDVSSSEDELNSEGKSQSCYSTIMNGNTHLSHFQGADSVVKAKDVSNI
eukprot:gene15050-6214_t